MHLGDTVGLEWRRWHQKRAEFLLHRLKNAESKAELMGLDTDSLAIEHSSEQSPYNEPTNLQSSCLG